MKTNKIFLFNLARATIFSAIAMLSNSARAQFFTGPAAAGAGGAGRASVDGGESTFLNPAGIAFIQRYNASIIAGTTKHPVTGDSTVLAASLADGTLEAAIPGALSFVREWVELPNRTNDIKTDISVTIGGFAQKKLGLGIAAHRITDQVSTPSSGVEYNQYNAHFGFIFVPLPSLGVGGVAYDFLPGDDSPVGVHVVPTLGLGVNYLYEKFFRVRLDLVRPDTNNPGRRINVSTGLETFFQELFAFRMGWHWKETNDQHFLTVGVGYNGPKLKLDYSFQKDVRLGENGRHLIDMWLPL